MIVASSIVFLPCTDIRRTVEFYHDTLGLPIAQRQSETLCIFGAAGGYWGFCQYADGRKPLSGPQGACLSLNLESNEAVWTMYERLKDRCPVHRAPAQHPDFPVFSFFLRDPDGYLVEFQKLNDPEARLRGAELEL